MPHISNSDKEMYEYNTMRLSTQLSGVPVGHLVYVLYVLALRWMGSLNNFTPVPFERRLAALGALNEAQHELRRLHLVDYEDGKIKDNGEAK